MSGHWLQALAIIIPALALLCFGLERLGFGRIANMVTFGALAVIALVIAALTVEPASPIADARLSGASRLDIRLEARKAEAKSEAGRPVDERVLAAPMATVPAAPAAAPPSPPPPAEPVRAAAPLPQCPPAPSDDSEQRCAARIAAATAAVRDEMSAAADTLRQEAEQARGRVVALGELVRRHESEIAGARAEAEQFRQAMEAAKAEIERARAAPPVVSPPSAPPPTIRAVTETSAPAQSPPAAPAPAAAAHPLKGKLEQGITVAAYVLQPLPAAELVRGQRGRYYSISLRNPGDSKPLLFDPGGYDLGDRVPQLEAAARRLRDDVLAQLGAGLTHRVFVQGFATGARFARARNLPSGDAALGKVAVHRRIDPEGFEETPVAAAIAGTYQNADLPVLRAAAVAAPLAKALGEAVGILDGGVRSNTDKQIALSPELILFIAW